MLLLNSKRKNIGLGNECFINVVIKDRLISKSKNPVILDLLFAFVISTIYLRYN